MLPEEDILPLIPQRPPFVMISKLLSSDESSTRTSLLVTEENIFVEKGLFREPGLMENIAQTAAARAGYMARLAGLPVQVGYIGAVKNLVITGLPKTNDEIITEIKIKDQVFDVTIISGTIWCREEVVAQCEMKIFIRPS
ncbi:MAG TPA: hypothetical protein VNS58_05375 [Puia sp.]|jgi:3-hydroxymyristoyl/3-hydroxydecanoyl-(acyl carrier protein) dehydratase|nr:hypothetical protein [Puia sp.]